MKIEFPMDNVKLGKVLYALAHTDVRPQMVIEYIVADQEAAKNELLGKAIQDSRRKAEILTMAAGVSLCEVVSIDYSWNEMEMFVRPLDRAMCMEAMADGMADSYSMDVEPDDIQVEDSVTVVWTIK